MDVQVSVLVRTCSLDSTAAEFRHESVQLAVEKLLRRQVALCEREDDRGLAFCSLTHLSDLLRELSAHLTEAQAGLNTDYDDVDVFNGVESLLLPARVAARVVNLNLDIPVVDPFVTDVRVNVGDLTVCVGHVEFLCVL